MKTFVRLVCSLALAAICLLFPEKTAARTAILERSINLRLHNTTLKEGLDRVAEKANFQWSYNASIIEGERRVTLLAEAIPVREALVRLLGDGYEYRQNGNYLILKKRKHPETRLSGYISDPKTGKKLPNATIYDRKTLRATTTDSNGYYELKVSDRTEVVVAKLDYRPTVLQVTPQTPRFVKIELAADSLVRPADCDTTAWKPKKWQLMSRFVNHLIRKSQRMVAAQERVAENVLDSMHRAVQVSFLPWIGSNGMMGGNFTNNLSLNVLVGYSRGNDGVELAGLGNVTRERMNGVQAAGLFNTNHGDAAGVQAAGLFNVSAGELNGGQFGGLFNMAGIGSASSVQAAGLLNVVERGQPVGLQAAGLVNVVDSGSVVVQAAGLVNAADEVSGVQAAGLVNAAGNVVGVQAAGLVNEAANFSGIQAAGLVNVADTLNGIQTSGFINRARRVNGLQVGIINSATEIKGLQIGLLNFSKRGGYVALEANTNDVLTANLAFKTGVPAFYLTYTAGFRKEPGNDLWGYGLGIGSRIPMGRHGVALDLTHRHLNLGTHTESLQEWTQFAPTFDLRLGRHFSFAGGPSANVFVDKPGQTDFKNVRDVFLKNDLVKETYSNGTRLAGWIGWSAAVRLKF